MTPLIDVMIDFETLGNGKDKCICQVGAVYFDGVSGELGAELKITIDASSHERWGGKLDAATVYWWLAQSEEARKSILSDNKVDVKDAFTELNTFLSGAKRIWSHATFDFVTLVETLKQLEIKPTFSYKAGLDLRTLTYLGKVSTSRMVREGTHHDALDDCKFQVKYAVESLNNIRVNKRLLQAMDRLLDD